MTDLRLELLRLELGRMDARGQGVACGKGWISPRAKCGKDKASQTPKENLAKTTEKRKKLHALKAEVEGKPSSARKGGKLALREKDEQQREPPKKKTSPIDAVNEKYASANPSDSDVADWRKDMAVASTIPDPEKAERKIANDLLGGRLGAGTKGREAIAEAIYQAREEARKGREYKASDFSFWGFQRDLDKAKAKVASSRATPEGRQKAQKLVDKLEATKSSELKSAQETADRLNQRDSGTKAERLAKINQELDEWISEDVAKQKMIHEKVKSGEKRAIADAAHEVARKLKTYKTPRDSRKASSDQADREAIREHLMDVHRKSGGDANVLGLKKGFTMRELRKAYRESAALAHPDKGGTEEKFRDVSEAYERLKSQARLDSLSARLDEIARAKTINGINYALNKNSRWERVKSGVAHGAVHLGENVAAWKVGKVVGGAIGQVAASHGADPEVARLLGETAVQALASTALYARGGKRSGTDIATHLIAQSAAAFSGKISHTGVDDLSEMLGGSERVQAISALVAGKMAGIGTVVAAHKSGVARKLAESLPAAKTRIGSLVGLRGNIRRDAVSRKSLNLAEVDNAAEMVMMGYAIAALDKYRGDSMGLALDLLRINLGHADAFPNYKSRIKTPAGTLGITHQPGDKRFGRPMMASYGHLQGTYGQAEDGKAWDFYLGDESGNEDLYEVLQTTEAGMPDERKFISHCRDIDHARQVFVSHAGQDRFGYIRPVGWDFFG